MPNPLLLISGNFIDKISDHLPNFLLLPKYHRSALKTTYQKRDYSNFNASNFTADINKNQVINTIINCDHTSQKFDIFQEHLNETLNCHVPLKNMSKREITQQQKPWLTKAILKSIKIRTKYYKQFM